MSEETLMLMNSEEKDENTSLEDITPSEGESNSDEENKDDSDNEDEDTNIAKHPRWKERENDWKKRFNDQEERHTGEIQKLRVEIEEKYGNKGNENTSEIPNWFGGDEDNWKEFLKWNRELVNEAKEEAIKNVTEKTTEEQKKIDEATTYFHNEIEVISNDKTLNPNGIKVDRNKLMKTVLDNELIDSKGRWNYKAGWKIMQGEITSVNQSKKNETISNKKKIAGATNSGGSSEQEKTNFITSEDFKNPSNRPW